MPDIDINSLPSNISTLKRQAKSRLPLIKMRSKIVPLRAEKQLRQKSEKQLIIFDLVYIFTTIIGLDIRGSLYISLGKFYDPYLQDELYKTYVQQSSIRTISSQFAYYRSRYLVLLSDFVIFYYSIVPIQCRKGGYTLYKHISRVIGIRRDCRTTTTTTTRGQIMLKV